MRHLLAIATLALAGCCWFVDEPLPEPATDGGLAASESRLDRLTDKRDSRVAAAVAVAKDKASEPVVVSELEVAQAMLPSPTAADLSFAKDRAAKGDDAFYAEQVEVSRQLAASLVKAAADYEREKARKQAEYDAALKEKEMALAAEQEARQSDKWTWAGIGLVALGVAGIFFSPIKAYALAVAVAGFAVGSFPIVSKQPWFGYAIGVVFAVLGLFAIYLITVRLKPRKSDEPNPPQDAQNR